MTHTIPILKHIKNRFIKCLVIFLALYGMPQQEGLAQVIGMRIGAAIYGNSSDFIFKNIVSKGSGLMSVVAPNDTILTCAQLPSGLVPTPAVTGTPKISTDCIYANSSFIYTDRYFETSCTQPFTQLPTGVPAGRTLPNTGDVVKVIVRTFTAKDICGNSATCEQVIFIRTVHLKNVLMPKDTVFDCSKVPNALTPSVTGVPQVDTDGDLNTINDRFNVDQACQLYFKYSDDTFRLCAGSYKIERTWTFVSLCTPNDPNTPEDDSRKTYVQGISVLDKTPPSVSAQFTQYYAINSRLVARDTAVDFDGYAITGGENFYGFRAHVYPLALLNGCGGKVRLSLKANDFGCSNGAVTFIVDDARVKMLNNYPVFNDIDKTTTAIFEGIFNDIGEYIFTIEAKDVCGYAIAKKTFRIVIRDNLSPQAVCSTLATTSLNNNGVSRIMATTIDGGSADNCGITRYEVRRMTNCQNPADTVFMPYVDFFCCDVGTTQRVVLRVYDYAGNYSDCMMSIGIEDRLKPSCIPPAPVTIGCKDVPFNDYNPLGTPALWDNCGIKDTIYTVVKNLNNCSVGTITRKWVFSDFTGRKDSCSQEITVTGKSDFTVDFPDDIVADCFAAVPSLEQTKTMMLTNPPTKDGHIVNNGCGTIYIEIKDDTLTSVPGACYMILRKIKVIDWCKFSFNNGSGDWNNSCYGQPVCGDVHSNTLWNTQNTYAWEFLPRSGCTVNTRERRFRDADGLVASSTNPLMNVQPNAYSDGVICFTQLISISDKTPPQFISANDTIIKDGGLGCQATVNITVKAEDQCNGVKLGSDGLLYSWTLADKTQPDVVISSGTGNKITTTLPYAKNFVATWLVVDRCGNQAFKQQNIKVIDIKTPSILCISKNAELGGTVGSGMVTVNVTDVVQGVTDNCSTISYLNTQLAFVRASDNPTNTYPSVRNTVLTFTCTDAGKKIPVQIWTRDEAGNTNYCLSEITVQDNLGLCTPPASITGAVKTEADKAINNVTITVLQNNTSLSSMTTTTSGSLNLTNLAKGQSYQVKASRTDNIGNGVTTFDIALISKHILGIQPLTSPYKLIAADVNKDGDINALDMLLIRRVILKSATTFPNNSAWRFIDKSFVFPNYENPFGSDFPEVVNLTNIPLAAQANFIGVKVGDVNNSVNPNLFISNELQVRSANALKLEVDDIEMKAGQEYEIVLKSDAFNAVGYQFTLNYTEGVELKNIKTGTLPSMNDNNFGKFKNAITTSWNGDASASEKLFSFILKANKDALLSDVLTIGSSITQAEAYTKNGEILNVELDFKGLKQADTEGVNFLLNQNQPNPFDDETTISFNIPKATLGKLTVFDATGKIVKSVEKSFSQGYNELKIQRTELNTKGVFFYRIETPTHSATKKMVIL